MNPAAPWHTTKPNLTNLNLDVQFQVRQLAASVYNFMMTNWEVIKQQQVFYLL